MARLIDAEPLIKALNDPRMDGTQLLPKAMANFLEREPVVELPRWIPVEERLPDEGIPVLVHGAGGENGFAIQTQWDGEWVVEWGGVWYPTHWMPLPEPPKGGSDNDKNSNPEKSG